MTEIFYSTGKPPNNLYNRCREKFGVDWDQGVIFTYGNTIYCKYPITEDLKVHESTHVKQQAAMGAETWWSKYFENPEFRLSQEVEAYRNQYNYIKENYNRHHRKFLYKHIISSMVNMYGDMVTEDEAKKLIV